MFFTLGRKIKKNQPPVAAVPLRAGFLPPDYPVVLKVAVHTAEESLISGRLVILKKVKWSNQHATHCKASVKTTLSNSPLLLGR